MERWNELQGSSIKYLSDSSVVMDCVIQEYLGLILLGALFVELPFRLQWLLYQPGTIVVLPRGKLSRLRY